jgi:uncharacterized membrane protein (DUF2068 family)
MTSRWFIWFGILPAVVTLLLAVTALVSGRDVRAVVYFAITIVVCCEAVAIYRHQKRRVSQ